MMKIYVGTLSSNFSEKELQSIFGEFGHVTSVYIWKSNENGDNYLYGLIEMPVKKQALSAIESLNGKKMKGLKLSVHPARFGFKSRRRTGRAGGRRSTDPSEEENT
ncbi:MAG: RNA-binding protein [Calditrichia bacterium]|nr:RNA-binding protein [Calditrichia bacterium]